MSTADRAGARMKVAVVSEFYPRADDPVLGVWAHRQALATRAAGADVRVIVLHRIVPPAATARRSLPSAGLRLARHPRRLRLDELDITYVRFVSPPRWRSYGSWGAWAAPSLARALRLMRRDFPYDLIHAHNAVPAADAVLRTRDPAPLVLSEHGADVFHTAVRHDSGRRASERAFGAARLVLANSGGVERAARDLGARRTRVVHLGTELPAKRLPRSGDPTIVTVAHLIERKRHADVLRAVWSLRERHPRLHYRIVGDGPERESLTRLAEQLGIADRVEFSGQLPHAEAVAAARAASLFVMPSVDEAFGVAYVEAMAGWVPVIAALGEPGPAEIARAGDGIRLVAPGDVEQLATMIDRLLAEPRFAAELGSRARETAESAFTWEGCGAATVSAYEEALRG